MLSRQGIRAASAGMLLAASCLMAPASLAQTATYPMKPVRIIVPYAPGGGADVIARVISQELGETLGQPVVVDNRAGGGGTIGTETAVRAAPDGYTFAFVSGAYTTMVAVHKPPYDPVRHITPIILVGEASSVAVVHPSVPIRSVKELVGSLQPMSWHSGTGKSRNSCTRPT